MKQLIINFTAVLIIGFGGLTLSQPMVTQANTINSTYVMGDSECKCANGSECSGDSCECTEHGCKASNDSVLEKIFG